MTLPPPLTPDELSRLAKLAGWEHDLATKSNPIERDGFKLPNHFGPDVETWWHKDVKGVFAQPPAYSTRDSIIALVEKQTEEVQEQFMFNLVAEIAPKKSSVYGIAYLVLFAPVPTLARALLAATK